MGIEVCGFLFGVLLVLELGIGFVFVCKFNKLFWDVFSESYELEYGKDMLEIYKDVILLGDKVLLIDDLLVIGGIIFVMVKLICNLGGKVEYVGFVIGLFELYGYECLIELGVELYCICEFEGE